MTVAESDKPILSETKFAGTISANGEKAAVGFRASVGADCRVSFDIDPVSPETYFIVVRGDAAPGEKAREFVLTGDSSDGKTISSETISLGPHGSKDDSCWFQLRARACKIRLTIDHPVKKPILRLWLRSFRSFRNPLINTVFGKLVVNGVAHSVSPDEMSGSITVEAPSNDPGKDWVLKAEDLLRHMHRGLSFAHGGRLQTPRLDYVHGSVFEMTLFEGTGFVPELPVQHHINQGPFIKALAERFERAGPLPDILWTAMGWMQTDTTIDETRFLTAMTALEAIIESELTERHGTIIAKADFSQLRKKPEDLIAADDMLTDEVKEIFGNKIGQLNGKTFIQKIHALFDHYAIPKRDYEGDAIRNLVRLRNDIVHKGVVPDGADIWPAIILVRELITRILLKEIGFVGRYCCYIGGLNDRDFPG